jgi:HK97 family phage major capsid protein
LLRDSKIDVKIHVIGIAASAASMIACAGKSDISRAGMIMIHNATSYARGDKYDLEQGSDMLSQVDKMLMGVYAEKTGKQPDDFADYMDGETFFTAAEAVEIGLIDSISTPGEAESIKTYAKIMDIAAADASEKMLKSETINYFKALIAGKNEGKTMGINELQAKRLELIEDVKGMIDKGDITASEKVKSEISDIESKIDEIAKAQANFNVLYGEKPKPPESVAKSDTNPTVMILPDKKTSDKYSIEVTAWAKHLMGSPLNEDELRIYNDYTHTTINTGVVIPETVAQGIWDEVNVLVPYWEAVSKTYVKGQFTIIKDATSTDAAWYEESTVTAQGTETFAKITLNGCELSRAISVSFKLKEMAVEDFIPYIQRMMAKKLAKALGYGVTYGAGSTATPPEPMGTVTYLLAESGTPQVITNTGGSNLYQSLTSARAKIDSIYNAGLAIYANSFTIWEYIANALDAVGRPLFIASPIESREVGRVLGLPVIEDTSMTDGDILISNARDGYACNINKEIAFDSEDHKRERVTDYIGYAIVDGIPKTSKAHALIRVTASNS